MTARKRESPYAKAVERIVIRHIPVGPAFDCDRAMLRSDILRFVARVERERSAADAAVVNAVRAIFDAEDGAEKAHECESYLVRGDLFEDLGAAYDQIPQQKGAKR